jgi:integrase
LTAESVAIIVKAAARAIGKAPEIFGGHSLRSGFATQVAKNGGQVADIMRQTRHKSVDTALKYVRIGQLFDRNPSTMLGL